MKKISTRSALPANAKRVFKGKLFDTFQWEQELYDGTKAIFERVKRPDTVVVYPVTTDGKVLILEQEQPHLSLYLGSVAGRVEEGETIDQAAERELLEETGYKAKEFIEFAKVNPSDKIIWTVHHFIAKGSEKVSEMKLDPGERISLKIVDFDEFLKIALQDNFYDREIKLRILKAKTDPEEIERFRKLFLD